MVLSNVCHPPTHILLTNILIASLFRKWYHSIGLIFAIEDPPENALRHFWCRDVLNNKWGVNYWSCVLFASISYVLFNKFCDVYTCIIYQLPVDSKKFPPHTIHYFCTKIWYYLMVRFIQNVMFSMINHEIAISLITTKVRKMPKHTHKRTRNMAISLDYGASLYVRFKGKAKLVYITVQPLI